MSTFCLRACNFAKESCSGRQCLHCLVSHSYNKNVLAQDAIFKYDVVVIIDLVVIVAPH